MVATMALAILETFLVGPSSETFPNLCEDFPIIEGKEYRRVLGYHAGAR